MFFLGWAACRLAIARSRVAHAEYEISVRVGATHLSGKLLVALAHYDSLRLVCAYSLR